jgi:hypothetical protein
MDQISIFLYLKRNGWTARVIHNDILATLGEAAIAYGLVTQYLREAQIGPCESIASSDVTPHHTDEEDAVILKALEELPLFSVRQVSRAIFLPERRHAGDFLRNSGFPCVIFDECHISCLTIRRQTGQMFKVPSDDIAGTRN